jgi:tRNA-2-methylthio-N6-dimethylallyladenosine synthase
VVAQGRFAQAFTFQYSKRPGTPAAELPDQLPKAVVQERYERLIALQEEISWQENKTQVGRTLDVLVAEGEGRKDDATARLSGRAADNRLVHFSVPEGAEVPRPGDVVTVRVTYAAPHHLVADVQPHVDADTHPVYAVRRTRAGDAWDRRHAESCGAPSGDGGRAPVSLGLPTLRH